MTERRKQQAVFIGVAVVLHVAILGSHSAFGWVPTCGATVPTGNQTVPTGTSLSCATPGCVLTISAATTLQMNGFALDCTGSGQTGICVTGPASTVKGPGLVRHCATGISTNAQGDVVKGVTAIQNGIGIAELAGAAGNGFVQNWVAFNTQAGILAQGGSVKIVKNWVLKNAVGIKLEGTQNFATKNWVLINDEDGILGNGTTLSGIQRNTVGLNNTTNISAGAGIHLDTGSGLVKVKSNVGAYNFNPTITPPFLNFEDDTVAPPCGTNIWGGNNTSLPAGYYTPSCAN